jgi:hypothetical protein
LIRRIACTATADRAALRIDVVRTCEDPMSRTVLLLLLAGCPKAPPAASPPGASTASCVTSADCRSGETCVGPVGCDQPWTCRPDVVCTMDLRAFCACDGTTVQGSGSCPPQPWIHVGPCGAPTTADACTAEGGTVAWPIGPPARCPEGTTPIGQVGPAGIEGLGLCCR